jgi:dTDP-glucose pyrophosphorylase
MIEESLWKKCLLRPQAVIEDAIKILDDACLGIVLICDEEMKLLGTVTDGDIRRGLLRGLSLTSPIANVINSNPTFVSQNLNRDAVLSLMSSKKIYQIPILDDNSVIIGLHIWDEDTTRRVYTSSIVIMAGGKGTRLLPMTSTTPKPMLPVSGMPIAEHIVANAKAQGFSNFIFAIYHLGEIIVDHFRDGKSFGVNIEYIRENQPLGTAGALGLIDPTPREPLIVANGDVLTGINYGELLDYHIENQAVATMAVHVHESICPYGVVQMEGVEISGYQEKPVTKLLVNAGVYVLDAKALEFIEESTPTDMPELLGRIKSSGLKVIAYPVHEKWIDIGTVDKLEQASRII